VRNKRKMTVGHNIQVNTVLFMLIAIDLFVIKQIYRGHFYKMKKVNKFV